ncbi:sulfate transport system permease protein [Mesocricetibacter intestinalis]|uniref:Sulfate transport system permease protein CysT n=1 Tax=Mesocricetibacter intestinalis TaxID=1521930 RepID=A0A4R6VK85_9PAST|nr:sulfate ABC transporter permease subunit CysT [Mesocricetibacter intestinalis]TDQ58969.1 sulfate transport system permease protein [Mesocricetibacter intestinalis]
MNYLLPGFRRGLTLTLLWLGSMLVLPLILLILTALQLEAGEIMQIISSPQVVASILLSFKMAFIAMGVNLLFGFVLAWILVRYDFFGKKLVDALIDLPFALPTAVAGIALASLYSANGLFGGLLARIGVQIAYTPSGIALALIFVSLPFVVRAVQPVLATLDPSYEEAAAILGASKLTRLRRILVPALLPALISGAGMGFARSLGEYGSVIFIAGNVPLVSEIAPLIIMSKLDLYDVRGASVVALLMLLISFLIILLINRLQWAFSKRFIQVS